MPALSMSQPERSWHITPNWITIWVTFLHQMRENRRMTRDLTRLAATSPHLLHDLGFTKHPASPQAPVQLWTNGEITIAIDRTTSAVTVTHHT